MPPDILQSLYIPNYNNLNTETHILSLLSVMIGNNSICFIQKYTKYSHFFGFIIIIIYSVQCLNYGAHNIQFLIKKEYKYKNKINSY